MNPSQTPRVADATSVTETAATPEPVVATSQTVAVPDTATPAPVAEITATPAPAPAARQPAVRKTARPSRAKTARPVATPPAEAPGEKAPEAVLAPVTPATEVVADVSKPKRKAAVKAASGVKEAEVKATKDKATEGKGNAAAKPVATKPAKKTAKKAKAVEVRIEPVVKVKRDKVVRDSFSMPKSEQAALKALRVALAKEGRIVSKSELLRAGLALLLQQAAADQLTVLDALPVVPKGKGKKDSE